MKKTVSCTIIGGGIGQSRAMMLLLREAHLGEVKLVPKPQKITAKNKEMLGFTVHV